MAKLIFRSNYFKNESAKHKSNYIRYLGTREGAEMNPELAPGYFYEDEDMHGRKKNYMDYISGRPGVVKGEGKEHGLFSYQGLDINIEQVMEEKDQGFRVAAKGSDARYGFSYFGGGSELFVFEAPIDLMSYMDMYPDEEKRGNYYVFSYWSNHYFFTTVFLGWNQGKDGWRRSVWYSEICHRKGDTSGYGQNAFFYDAEEGVLTASILLVAEFCKPEERHIISVFMLIQDLLAPSKVKGKNQFQILMEKLPSDHKAKWFAGAALNTAEQARALMTPDELKSLPKGNFIVSKTGAHPMKTKLNLFLKWGITFEEPYEVEEKAARKVRYADKDSIEEEIVRRYQNCVGEEKDMRQLKGKKDTDGGEQREVMFVEFEGKDRDGTVVREEWMVGK